MTMKSRAAILTLGEPIHKWETGAVEASRNPFTVDDIQPPIVSQSLSTASFLEYMKYFLEVER